MNRNLTTGNQRISDGFERAAMEYDDFAELQRSVGTEMLQRLELVSMIPQTILDVGCGTGFCTRQLHRVYNRARIIGIDLAASMLQQARSQRGWFSRQVFVQADAAALPVQPASIDLVLSNLMLQWCDPVPVFSEFRRVLKADGLLMFSSFGPDTLMELRQAWAEVDELQHVIDFIDMHDLGDGLLQAGFREPVMDVDRYTLSYRDVLGLLRDLHGIGSRNIAENRTRGLMGRGRLHALQQAYAKFANNESLLPASYEVVYGHAWSGGKAAATRHANEATITLEHLRRQL